MRDQKLRRTFADYGIISIGDPLTAFTLENRAAIPGKSMLERTNGTLTEPALNVFFAGSVTSRSNPVLSPLGAYSRRSGHGPFFFVTREHGRSQGLQPHSAIITDTFIEHRSRPILPSNISMEKFLDRMGET